MSSLLSHFNVDEQTIGLVLLSLILTFILSSILVFTYEKTSREVVQLDHFIQSIILMSIVTSVVMQSIGDSLARSFGIFGALTILRFRVDVTSPRNISFIFAAMAVGISCGVYSFVTATIGTLFFVCVAFLLRLSPYSKTQNMNGNLRFNLMDSPELNPDFNALLERHCRSSSLKKYRFLKNETGQTLTEFQYKIQLKKEMNGLAFLHDLEKLDQLSDIRLTFIDAYPDND